MDLLVEIAKGVGVLIFFFFISHKMGIWSFDDTAYYTRQRATYSDDDEAASD